MRVMLVPILLCLLLAACTTDEVAHSAYAGAKTACRLNPAQCTINPDAQ